MDISVLLPVYHRDQPQAFKEALESVGPRQTFPPREIVVVKDGPLPKGLEAVIESFGRENPSLLRIVALPWNMGLARALNLGLKECRFPWVARMDADDISLPQRFEIQVDYLRQHPEISILGTWTADFDDDPRHIIGIRPVPSTHEELVSFSKKRCPFIHPSVLMRRDDILAVGGYPENVGSLEDYALWGKCIMAGLKMACIPQVLVLVRTAGMVKRRGGWRYARDEWRLFWYFREIGFLSRREWLLIGLPRVLFRFLPAPLRQRFYRTFLRERVKF